MVLHGTKAGWMWVGKNQRRLMQQSYIKLAKALRRMASQAAVMSPPLKRASTRSSTSTAGELR